MAASCTVRSGSREGITMSVAGTYDKCWDGVPDVSMTRAREDERFDMK